MGNLRRQRKPVHLIRHHSHLDNRGFGEMATRTERVQSRVELLFLHSVPSFFHHQILTGPTMKVKGNGTDSMRDSMMSETQFPSSKHLPPKYKREKHVWIALRPHGEMPQES